MRRFGWLVAVLLLVGACTGGTPEAKAAQVRYERPLAAGAAPFTSPVDVSAASVGAEIPSPSPGDQPFGGSGSNTVCDREKLIEFLTAKPDRLAEWARVLEVDPDEVPGYIRRLQPATLTKDTRFTNHGFRDGKADPFQSVLPAGTAVLVDESGRAVVRCRCGNPLLDPKPVAGEVCVGCPKGYRLPAPAGGPAPVVVVVNPPPAGERVTAAAVLGHWSGDWGNMYLKEVGGRIRGIYDHDDGRVIGDLRDNRFVGWWSEVPSRRPNGDAGAVEFIWIRQDGKLHIDGRWRFGADGVWHDNWDLDHASTEIPPDIDAKFAIDADFPDR